MKVRWLVAASGLVVAVGMSLPAQAAPSAGLRDFALAAQQTSGVEQTHYRRYRHYRHYRHYGYGPNVYFYSGHRHRYHHRYHRHW